MTEAIKMTQEVEHLPTCLVNKDIFYMMHESNTPTCQRKIILAVSWAAD
jgi:hypothetical protein